MSEIMNNNNYDKPITQQHSNMISTKTTTAYVALDINVVPRSEYDKLVNENSDLLKQISELTHKLKMAGIDYDKLDSRMKVLTSENENLKKDIEVLREENKRLMEEIKTLKEANKSLNETICEMKEMSKKQDDKIEYLLKKEKDREDKMLTREFCLLLENTIVRHVMGDENTRVKYTQLVESTITLNPAQQKRWEILLDDLKKDLDDGIKTLNYYLIGFKLHGNKEAHDNVKSHSLTTIDIKEAMSRHVCVYKSHDKKNYLTAVDYLLHLTENKFKLGNNPFKNKPVQVIGGFKNYNKA